MLDKKELQEVRHFRSFPETSIKDKNTWFSKKLLFFIHSIKQSVTISRLIGCWSTGFDCCQRAISDCALLRQVEKERKTLCCIKFGLQSLEAFWSQSMDPQHAASNFFSSNSQQLLSERKSVEFLETFRESVWERENRLIFPVIDRKHSAKWDNLNMTDR